MYIDLHSDTIYTLECHCEPTADLEQNALSVSASSIRENHVWQCQALFVPMKSKWGTTLTPWEKVNALHERFLLEKERCKLKQLLTTEDFKGDHGVILTTEEGGSIEGKLERLETLASWGVKIFGFTWNYENELGYPNSKEKEVMEKGLKEKGIEAIAECERNGLVVDVSHLSEGGFWDVAKYSQKPFVATHSNARALMDHTRNLSDEMLKALADKGGVAGLNFYPAFVSESNLGTVEELASHVEHMVKVAGEDIIAIGTDFDGFGGKTGINTPGEMHLLFEELANRGFTSRQLEKLMHGNAIRVFQECEKH